MPNVVKCRYHENCDGHGLGGFEPTKTKQSFKEECDINEILKRASNGQDISGSLNARIAQYGDVSSIPDFHSAMNIVNTAQAMFMELDANLRERFDNDPGKFLEFVQNDDNREEAQKLGLLKPKEGPKDGKLPGGPVTPPAASTGGTGGGNPPA